MDLAIVGDKRRTAVEACSARAFDLILMDTHMPVMDGLTATRAIRAMEAQKGGPRTPIVSLTADAMPSYRCKSAAGGRARSTGTWQSRSLRRP